MRPGPGPGTAPAGDGRAPQQPEQAGTVHEPAPGMRTQARGVRAAGADRSRRPWLAGGPSRRTARAAARRVRAAIGSPPAGRPPRSAAGQASPERRHARRRAVHGCGRRLPAYRRACAASAAGPARRRRGPSRARSRRAARHGAERHRASARMIACARLTGSRARATSPGPSAIGRPRRSGRSRTGLRRAAASAAGASRQAPGPAAG